MFKIYDGRETFYQWDINQKLIVADDSITEVHFSNRSNNLSLVCDIQNEGDLRVVSVPNVLLQTNLPIIVYAYRKDHTEVSETFKVIEKDKPEDYIYTPDEVKTWEELSNRITELEQSESVLYTAQELTEEQKAQARQNIGSFDFFEIPNLIKFNVKSKPIFGDKIVDGEFFALDDFQPIDINTADAETVEAWRIVYNYFSLKPMQKFVSNISALQALALLIDKNMLGENFYSTHDYLNPALFGRNKKFIKVYSYYSNDAEKKAIAGFVYDLEQSLGQFTYNVLTNTIEYYNYSYPLTAAAATSTDGKELISQTNMRADPTEPMQIATKQYVDNSIAAGGTDISLGLTSAAVGQTIKVKAVDENGKPTEWEAADMPSGEASFPKFEKLLTHTITEEEIAANPTAFMWNTTQIPNLNDFNVFTLTIRNPDNTTKITFTKWVRLKINNVLMGGICGTSQGEGYKYSISANRLYGFWVSDSIYNPNNDAAMVLTPPYLRRGIDSNLAASEAVTSIGFTSYAGDYGLTAGIVVEIWGAK